jgi:hypothetical protein
MLKIALTAALFALPLGGCMATHGPHSPEVAAVDDRECQSYGAKPGSDAYISCRVTKNQQHEAAMAAVLAGSAGGSSTCNQVGTATVCN